MEKTYRNLKKGFPVGIELGWKPYFLKRLRGVFGFDEWFNASGLENHFNMPRSLIHNRVRTLLKNGWLKKRRLTKAKLKDSAEYRLSEKKYDSFVNHFGSLESRPKPVKEVIKEVVEVEKKYERSFLPKEKW